METLYNERLAQVEVGQVQIVDFRNHKQQNINALAESIDYNGLTNPITIEERMDGSLELIAGYHRLQAFKRLGKKTIPAMVRKYNKNILDRDRELQNKRDKNEENLCRQILTLTEISNAYMELENAYINAFPDYRINPIKFIEIYKQKLEQKKRAENELKLANTPNEKKNLIDLVKETTKDIDRLVPPMEELKGTYNLKPKEVEVIQQITEAEKMLANNEIKGTEKLTGAEKSFITTLQTDKVPKATLLKVVKELTKPQNLTNYMTADQEERKEIIATMKKKADVSDDIKNKELPKIKLQEGIFEIGKVKKHCAIMADKRHLVPLNKFNVVIEVKNNNLFDVVSSNIVMAHTSVLAVMYSKDDLQEFVDLFPDLE